MTRTGRRIVLGVSGHETAHLIAWAGRIVESGDTVRIVHAYSPIPYAATDWQLPVESDSLVREATARHVRQAAARLRRQRPDVVVMDELTGTPPATALIEAARDADLVLVGVPHCDRSRTVLARLLARAGCPVVVLGPADPVGAGPVTAVLRGTQADDQVLRAGFAEARKRRTGLLVLKPWQPPLDGGITFAETAEQKALDGYLAGWLADYPDVGVAAEVRFGDVLQVLTEHAMTADLLVVGLAEPAEDRQLFDGMLDAVISARTRPTMVISESVRDRARPLVASGAGYYS
ncbi:MAG TPA: universal stress protein [Jatrophihabitans sp.]|nr:universal stress protein [Jatrophihabitans sp.]